ncbi:MAG: hypothetical protein ABIR63_01350 [Sphingomicrobium sp.]
MVNGDIRPVVLLALWVAQEGGEQGLSRDTLAQRIRAKQPVEILVNAAIGDLKEEAFIGVEYQSENLLRLTQKGMGWIRTNYDLDKAKEKRNFARIRGGDPLPTPSKDYAELLPKRNWVATILIIAVSLGLIVFSHYVRRLG